MPIVAEQMQARGLIEDSVDGGFRATSYDLHVGTILVAPKEDKRFHGNAVEDIRVSKTGFSLPPQGMVRVSLLNWGPTLQKVFKAVQSG